MWCLSVKGKDLLSKATKGEQILPFQSTRLLSKGKEIGVDPISKGMHLYTLVVRYFICLCSHHMFR